MSPLKISYRCIQETTMQLLPRLARFDRTKFTNKYLKDTLNFLTSLNNVTTFLPASASTSSNSAHSSSTSQISVNQLNNVNNNISFGLGTLKSEVIFCVGFMSLALGNKSNDFFAYAKQFIEVIRTSPLMSSTEVRIGSF